MRLIDADMLNEVITKLNAQSAGITRSEYKRIDNVLFNFPTIEERKAGKWLLNEDRSKEHVENIYICSACYNYEAWGETERTRYCPQCGSRMLETKED